MHLLVPKRGVIVIGKKLGAKALFYAIINAFPRLYKGFPGSPACRTCRMANFILPIGVNMFMETITISKKKYESLKKKATVDKALVAKLQRAFEDIKHRRVTEWKPSKKTTS